MADRPELLETTKRRLALQFAALLKECRLTEERFHWRAAGRKRLRREHEEAEDRRARRAAATYTRGPGGPGRSSRDEDEWAANRRAAINRAVDEIGIPETIALAREWYPILCSAYGLPAGDYETELSLRDSVERWTLEDVARAWVGRTKVHDWWWKWKCGSAVKKVLDALVEAAKEQARKKEIARLKNLETEASKRAAGVSPAAETPASPALPAELEPGKRGRGRPPIALKLKEEALKRQAEAATRGKTLTGKDVAQILYEKKNPTSRQRNDALTIMKTYAAKKKRKGTTAK